MRHVCGAHPPSRHTLRAGTRSHCARLQDLFKNTERVKAYLDTLASRNRALRCVLAMIYPCRAALVQRWFAGRAAEHIPYECDARGMPALCLATVPRAVIATELRST